MATYKIPLKAYASYSVTVEADSYDEALDLAFENADTTLCHQCSKVDLGDFEEDDYYYVDGVEVSTEGVE